MKNLRATSRNFLFAILLAAVVLITVFGCAPKIYLSSYSDPEFDFRKIEKVAIILEKQNIGMNLLFAEMFTQTVLERRKFFLVGKGYIPEEEMSGLVLPTGADAFLKISLTYCHAGFRTRSLPTSIGASAKLVETKTGKMVWNMNYAYSSSKTGGSAPMLEEVMKIAAEELIDSVPLEYTVPSLATPEEEKYEEQTDVLAKVELPEEVAPQDEEKAAEIEPESPAPGEQAPVPVEQAPVAVEQAPVAVEQAPVPIESLTPFASGPYLIHAASVRVKRRHAAEEFVARKTDDATIRLAKLVDLETKGRWYRLLIGRFKSKDDCWSYIRKSKQRREIDKESRPVKLPFSLLISTGESLDTSQNMVEDLRKRAFMAYLSPTAGKVEAYDVLVGAYKSEEEAAEEAEALFQNGILAKIISP